MWKQEREPFVQAAKRTPVDLQEWAVGLMERHNRRSHLAPQLSPATQELLRSSDSPPYGSASQTPTTATGEVPISSDDVRSQLVSPREQVVNTINGIRSPTKNVNVSLGKSVGAPFHPGLGRLNTTSSIPQPQQVSSPHPLERAASASAATFTHTIPIRPAPPAGPLPPPPPRKDVINDPRDSRRQQSYPPQQGYPPQQNNGYGYANY
jgi:mitogen-activated protein kinase kinase